MFELAFLRDVSLNFFKTSSTILESSFLLFFFPPYFISKPRHKGSENIRHAIGYFYTKCISLVSSHRFSAKLFFICRKTKREMTLSRCEIRFPAYLHRIALNSITSRIHLTIYFIFSARLFFRHDASRDLRTRRVAKLKASSVR